MKKYLEILKISFKAQIIYRMDVLFQLLFGVTKIIFASVVWGVIFGSRSEVAGFTLNTMLSYYIVSSFLSCMDLSDITGNEMTWRIRDGTFSKYMVVPARVFGYFGAQTAGKAAFYLSFNLIGAVVWVVLFQIRFAITADALLVIGALLMAALGLVFMLQLNYFLGILTFKFQDVWMFMMIKNNIVQFVTGSLIPLALLPQPVIDAMRLLPFYYVTYLPSMLLIGRNGEELLSGLITIAVWVAAFVPLNMLTYNHLRKRYEGVGI